MIDIERFIPVFVYVIRPGEFTLYFPVFTRPVKDGEFQTACSAACGNGAMVFGDINDKTSKVAKLKEDNRMYHLLEHVGVKPNVMYHTKVRNTTEV